MSFSSGVGKGNAIYTASLGYSRRVCVEDAGMTKIPIDRFGISIERSSS